MKCVVMKNNALYIPFECYQPVGGLGTFMGNLQTYLDQQEYPYLLSPDDAKVIFFPVSYSPDVLNRIKSKGSYIIQRLDGIYYPSKHGKQYVQLNEEIRNIYLNYADCIIFQSRYSQTQCFSMFGERKNTTIIVNGVPNDIFYPAQYKKNNIKGNKVKLITTGYFRNPDMLEPIVRALDRLKKEIDFEFTVVGTVMNPALESYLERAYIKYIGIIDHKKLADILRDNSIFLYSHLNPPCPNSVVEAISCGLPVVGFDSGAMSELCFFSKDLLAYVSDDIFQKYENFDYHKLAEKIVTAVENYKFYREIALAHSHLYRFKECGEQYLKVFRHYLRKRRKVIPFLTYKTKHESVRIVQKILHTIKNFLLKWLVLSPSSLVKRILLRINQEHFTTMLSSVMNQKFEQTRFADVVFSFIRQKASLLSPTDALKFLFYLENKLYDLEGKESVRYGNGLHTKHQHIKYHDFFVKNIAPGSRILDVGCGNGTLAFDIATQVDDVFVYGIDISENNIQQAQQKFFAENIEFVCGDALNDLPDQTFDVIVLSNVLEHIEKRIDFLRELQNRYHPKKFLIRVPMFERDWRVPLKKELGVTYRLDATHYIEYQQEEFVEEIAQAGLHIKSFRTNWGEIWTEVALNDS